MSLTVPGTLWDRSVGQVLGLKTGYGEVSIEDKVVHGVTWEGVNNNVSLEARVGVGVKIGGIGKIGK